jgi:fatty acid desaturase
MGMETFQRDRLVRRQTSEEEECERRRVAMLGTILWLIIALLVVFWLFGAFVANLGEIVWIALVIAAILLVYNLLTAGRTRV